MPSDDVKSYLITGASGFIGRALEARLKSLGHKVVRAVKNSPVYHGEIKCSLEATVDTWEKALDAVDGVFHLAWSTTPESADNAPDADLETNVTGTVRLLEALRKRPAMPLVFASSGGAVYGVPETTKIDECHPLRPLGVYGVSKVSAELYAMAYRRRFGIDARILRLSNLYGPGQNIEGRLGAGSIFAWRAITNQSIKIWGNGAVVRDYVFIDDAVSAFIAMMNVPAGVFQGRDAIVNVGSGVGVSLLEIIGIIEQLLKRKIAVEFLPERKFDVMVNILDVTLGRRLLKWSPQIEFKDGMQKTVSYLRAQINTAKSLQGA